MHLLDPGRLAWLWLLLPVVLLFLVRRRPRREVVSTLAFFKALARVYQEAPWLRRLKRLLALLLALATISSATYALAHLVRAPEAGEARSIVIAVDVSASMAAQDAQGRSRLQQAQALLAERIAGLDASVSTLLLRYDRRPEILLPYSRDRRALRRAIAQLAVRPIEGDSEVALTLAARLARLEQPAELWHVTDEADLPLGSQTRPHDSAPEDPESALTPMSLRERLNLPEGVALRHLRVGAGPSLNAGITALSLRRRPLEHGAFDAFVELRGMSAEPLEVRLVVRRDGSEIALRDLTLDPRRAARLILPLEAATDSTLLVELECKGDALALDNIAFARVPKVRPRRLLWVRANPDPYTQLAWMALAEKHVLEAFAVEPGQWPPPDVESFDLLVFDGWIPPTWPERQPVLLIQPPGSLGPVRTVPLEGEGLALDRLRAVDDAHPLLYGVASDRIALTQTGVVEAHGSLSPLWVGPAGPLLVAGDVRGQRLAVMAFSPQRSERLALLPSFPLLLGNAVLWLARMQEEDDAAGVQRSGATVDVEAESIVWTDAGGRTERVALGKRRIAELDRLGYWEAAPARGAVSLLSLRETLGWDATDAQTSSAVQATSEGVRGDLRGPLLWLLFALLVIEAWLFHRHSVS